MENDINQKIGRNPQKDKPEDKLKDELEDSLLQFSVKIDSDTAHSLDSTQISIALEEMASLIHNYIKQLDAEIASCEVEIERILKHKSSREKEKRKLLQIYELCRKDED